MRRSVWLFLSLLAAIDSFVFFRFRLIELFQATLLLNTVTCVWFIFRAFFAPQEHAKPRRVIQPVLVVLLLMLNSIVFMGVYKYSQLLKYPVIAINAPTPIAGWTAFDGTKHSFSEISGHDVVLHFWATWCIPCRKEFPTLLAFANRHPNVIFLVFSVKDDAQKAKRFIANSGGSVEAAMPPNVHYAWDPDSEVSHGIFNNLAFPSSIFIDKKGQMRRKFITPVEWDGKTVADYLNIIDKP